MFLQEAVTETDMLPLMILISFTAPSLTCQAVSASSGPSAAAEGALGGKPGGRKGKRAAASSRQGDGNSDAAGAVAAATGAPGGPSATAANGNGMGMEGQLPQEWHSVSMHLVPQPVEGQKTEVVLEYVRNGFIYLLFVLSAGDPCSGHIVHCARFYCLVGSAYSHCNVSYAPDAIHHIFFHCAPAVVSTCKHATLTASMKHLVDAIL